MRRAPSRFTAVLWLVSTRRLESKCERLLAVAHTSPSTSLHTLHKTGASRPTQSTGEGSVGRAILQRDDRRPRTHTAHSSTWQRTNGPRACVQCGHRRRGATSDSNRTHNWPAGTARHTRALSRRTPHQRPRARRILGARHECCGCLRGWRRRAVAHDDARTTFGGVHDTTLGTQHA